MRDGCVSDNWAVLVQGEQGQGQDGKGQTVHSQDPASRFLQALYESQGNQFSEDGWPHKMTIRGSEARDQKQGTNTRGLDGR